MEILNVAGDTNGFAPIALTAISSGLEDGATFSASRDTSIAEGGSRPAMANKFEL